MFIFGFDVIISANNGILKYVKTRNEDGFQAKRYTNICLITSSIISFTFVLIRAIHSKLFQANGIFGVLVILFILCMIIFIVFFYMLIILLIGNKIYDNN